MTPQVLRQGGRGITYYDLLLGFVQHGVNSHATGIWSTASPLDLLPQPVAPEPKAAPPQYFARFKWLQDRQSELLNTQYFHVVFTLPQQIATIAYQIGSIGDRGA